MDGYNVCRVNMCHTFKVFINIYIECLGSTPKGWSAL